MKNTKILTTLFTCILILIKAASIEYVQRGIVRKNLIITT